MKHYKLFYIIYTNFSTPSTPLLKVFPPGIDSPSKQLLYYPPTEHRLRHDALHVSRLDPAVPHAAAGKGVSNEGRRDVDDGVAGEGVAADVGDEADAGCGFGSYGVCATATAAGTRV